MMTLAAKFPNFPLIPFLTLLAAHLLVAQPSTGFATQQTRQSEPQSEPQSETQSETQLERQQPSEQQQPSDQQQSEAIRNTQPETVPFTPADEAIRKFELPPGFEVSLFAAEPDVHQPIAATWDARGRLWVVENYTYADRKTNYDLTVRDRVVIFEDHNGDGQFDRKTVFWDRGQKVTGIELGFGGVWLTAAPDLLFIPDRDRDDRPDSEPETVLTGFEGNVIRHNIVNGLRWGPDGWLYGRHGIQATSFVGAPGSRVRVPLNCSVWRIHPVKKTFEVVAQGGTNPWGFDFDQHGEMFISNTVIGHLFHIVPGARYRRMYGSHFNPNLYGVIEQTADHFHWDVEGGEKWRNTKTDGLSSGTDLAGGGHAHCGLLIYQGDNWPEEYQNRLLMANFHGRRINTDLIHREGNSYVVHHGPDIFKTDDPWFRGIELLCGPDGSVFVLDWSDIGECHENDGIHRTSGRIYKFSYANPDSSGPVFAGSLRDKTDQELVDLLRHDNQWFVRKARRLLQERAVENRLIDIDAVAKVLQDRLFPGKANDASPAFDETDRLAALWSMYSCGMADESLLHKATEDPDEHVRAWAVRLLADRGEETSAATNARFVELARQEPSGLVRLYLASALRRMAFDARMELAFELCAHAEDAGDRVQPKLIWFQIEPAIVVMPQRATELAAATAIPLIRENICRRLFSEMEGSPGIVAPVCQWLAREQNEEKLRDGLAGISKALEGWTSANAPDGWKAIDERVKAGGRQDQISLATGINLVFGDGRTAAQLESMIADKSAGPETRRRAIRSWSATRPENLFEVLKPLITDRSLTTAVVRGLVYCDNDAVPNVIGRQFPHMDPEGQNAAVLTLCARQKWAVKLLELIQSERIPKERVTARHAMLIYNFDDPDLRGQLESTWGRVRDTPEEKLNTINRLSTSLFATNNPSDPVLVDADRSQGRALFQKNCANCHTLFGTGGNTGPDLTGADRFNLNYLLVNIVDPASSVADSYRSSIIELEDGITITGLVLEQTDRIVRVQTPEEIIVIDRNEIARMKQTELSVMPEGILENMEENEIRDLFGYLFSKHQVPMPESADGDDGSNDSDAPARNDR